MRPRLIFRKEGVTLLELLVALIISGFVLSAIYRLFVVQTRAYTVQDQVVEVQQNVRSGMEILLRDLRMTGYDDENTPAVMITTPIAMPVAANSITVSYEYLGQVYTVNYWVSAPPSPTLFRQVTTNGVAQAAEALLPNVDNLTFTYGLDANDDGTMDDQNGDGIINNNDWVAAAGVGVTTKVVGVRVTLTGRPDQTNPDVQTRVSPRTLTSAVSLRNLMMR
jgi:prepilin-type N-terminal cleavage/methylation domain-containing protein